MAKKYYSALLTQASTNAPTAASAKGTIGTPTLAYVTEGDFTLVKTGAFTENKTKIKIGTVPGHSVTAIWTDVDTISIKTQVLSGDAPADANNVLDDTLIEIEIDE